MSTGVADLDTAELWKQFREQLNEDARTTLIAKYTPYAKAVSASVYARRTDEEIEFDDFFQLGIVGLIESVDRYELNSEATFETFASHRIRGAILSGLENMSERREQVSFRTRMRKERLNSVAEMSATGPEGSLFDELVEVALGLAICYMLEDTGLVLAKDEISASQAYRTHELAQLKEQLIEAVKYLPERERSVIKSHYFQGKEFAKISDELVLTKGRVSQLHKQALKLLRKELANGETLEGYF